MMTEINNVFIALDSNNEISPMKYPCIAHNKSTINMDTMENIDTPRKF